MPFLQMEQEKFPKRLRKINLYILITLIDIGCYCCN